MTITRQQLADVAATTPKPLRRGARARLSVVLISMGEPGVLAAALSRLAPKCRELEAELIVIRAGEDIAGHSFLHPYPDLTFLSVPADSPLSMLREHAMRAAAGDIITFRLDDEVDDLRWLAPFRRHVGQPAAAASTFLPLGDAAPARLSVES